ncbi:PD-(D/E)XK nuclease-like domain-containing protein [Brevundimonas sp. NIBR11]|uniref:PD-(D/E)XK nuclease-like domain-containing protein n=1 Tax=Brevundimonas sp. NIBR11 TaxID=3015999 RepID=UPI0022F0B75A|nr:PD-(D/E)XK nuclease-like domain-containing protein [Brevundimonas sp. NIBR11]WGM31464.1 Exodeoxyribonuclease 8 [Brevundimonas sp. NIBR11]
MTAETAYTGKIIQAPGSYIGMSMEAYHGQPCEGPSISSSGLRTIWTESPAHFWAHSSLNPNRVPPKENEAFNVGRLAHKLLIEGREGLEKDFSIRPDEWDDYRTKAARAWRDEQLLAGKTVVTEDDLADVTGMADSLGRHPLVRAGILDGKVERSLIWKDEETGVWLKARPDVIPNASGLVADLKTTTSVRTDALEKSLGAFGYHVQAALVGMGLRATLGIEMEEFALVWVEKEAPWCVRITTLTGADIERGQHQVRAALRTFADCLSSGRWPGPGGDRQDAEYLALPTWAAKRIDTELELIAAETPDNDNHLTDEAA